MDAELGRNFPEKNKKDPRNFIQEKGDTDGQVEVSTEKKPKAYVTVPETSSQKHVTKTQSRIEYTYKELVTNECWQKHIEKLKEIQREEDQKDENAEILDLPLPFRALAARSSLTDLHNLLQQCPQPQPPIINKELKTLQLNVDQAFMMAEQIKKMKTGLERLQAIIQKFNSADKFKKDVDFIIANIRPALARAEKLRNSKINVTEKLER